MIVIVVVVTGEAYIRYVIRYVVYCQEGIRRETDSPITLQILPFPQR